MLLVLDGVADVGDDHDDDDVVVVVAVVVEMVEIGVRLESQGQLHRPVAICLVPQLVH